MHSVSINSHNIMCLINSLDKYYLKAIIKKLNAVIESANNSKQKSKTIKNYNNLKEKVLSAFQKTALHYYYMF